METPVILSACRTPIGKFGGSLASLTALDLGATAIGEAVRQANVNVENVDEVIMGNVLTAGLGQAPARQAALQAGLPPSVAAVTVNKVCGSGLKAIMLGAQAIRCGDADVVVAGGMESMSHAPYVLARQHPRLGDRQLVDSMLNDGLVCAHSAKAMGVIAQQLADKTCTAREDQDAFAAESHRRAVAAVNCGAFDNEIVSVDTVCRSGDTTVQHDEGPRADTSVDALARLAPAFGSPGSVTPGNASMISDGAAAVVLASQRFAQQHNLRPLATLVAAATAGCAPEDLFTAPVSSMQRVLKRCGRSLEQIDLIELNEAFAVQVLACLRLLDLSHEKVNVHGGAIALGHPIGASGARVATTLIHALHRHEKQLGLASLCLGGGNAVAVVLERWNGE